MAFDRALDSHTPEVGKGGPCYNEFGCLSSPSCSIVIHRKSAGFRWEGICPGDEYCRGGHEVHLPQHSLDRVAVPRTVQLQSVVDVPLIKSWVLVLDQAPHTMHLDYEKVVRSRASTDKHYLSVYAQNINLVLV